MASGAAELEPVEQRERVPEAVVFGDRARGVNEIGGSIAVARTVPLEEDAREVELGARDPARRTESFVRDERLFQMCLGVVESSGDAGKSAEAPAGRTPAVNAHSDDDVLARPRHEPLGERAFGGVIVDRVADVGEQRDADCLVRIVGDCPGHVDEIREIVRACFVDLTELQLEARERDA